MDSYLAYPAVSILHIMFFVDPGIIVAIWERLLPSCALYPQIINVLGVYFNNNLW
jgi:hypothetical protein